MLKMRLAVMGSTITDDDMLAHILNNVSKSYEGVVTNPDNDADAPDSSDGVRSEGSD